jgi:hypothetical protein
VDYKRIPFAAHIKGDNTSGFMAGFNMSKKVILRPKAGATPGLPGFVGWLAAVHPKLYSMVQASAPNQVSAIENMRSPGAQLSGDVPAPTAPSISGTALQQFVSTVTQAGAAILPLVQQQKILNLQLQRAKQGLPPLDVGAYIDPNQGLNVGLNPATQRTLLWLGGGLFGAWVLTRVLRR